MDGAVTKTALPPAKPVNPSCFGTIEDVRQFSFDVASKVDEIASRLCGDPPPAKDSSGLQAAAFGLLGVGTQHAVDVRANLERIFEAMRRIEVSLP